MFYDAGEGGGLSDVLGLSPLAQAWRPHLPQPNPNLTYPNNS